MEAAGVSTDAPTLHLASRVVGVILDQDAGLTGLIVPGDSLARWLIPVEDLRRRLSAAQPWRHGWPVASGGASPPRWNGRTV